MNEPACPIPGIQDNHDIEWRIGRNLLLLQRIELNLKKIVSIARVNGPAETLHEIILRQDKLSEGKTLGTLLSEYRQRVLTPPSDDSTDGSARDEVHVSFGFSLQLNEPFKTEHDLALTQLLIERNDLVHKLLALHDLESHSGKAVARKWLDSQHETASSFLTHVRELLTSWASIRGKMADTLNSPQILTEMESAWLKQSPLAIRLGLLAEQIARKDGWTVFPTAAQILREQLPEEILKLKSHYNHSGLLSMARAAGVFEFDTETTQKGGHRIIYRIGSAWKLEPLSDQPAEPAL